MPKLIHRRTFLNRLLGGAALAWLGSVLYPITRYLFPPQKAFQSETPAKVAKVSLFPRNSGKIVKFGNKPALLLRSQEGTFKAFTAKCTHLDCLVQYRPEDQKIWCACHNGVFDLNGKNISGPPPSPLEEYAVRIEGDDVIIQRQS